MLKDNFNENSDIKDIGNKKINYREFEGMEPDEIFKQITGSEVPKNEKEKIELAKILQDDVFRRKICIEIISKRNIIYKWVKFSEFFTINSIYQDIIDSEDLEIPKSTIGRFLHKLAKAGFINKREFKQFKSKKLSNQYRRGIIYFWLKSYFGEELTKVYSLSKWDEFYYSKEIKELELELLKQENKRPKTNEEVVKKNLERGKLFKIEKIKYSMDKNQILKDIANENVNSERQEKEILELEQIIKIKNGEICPSGVSKQHLEKIKGQITKYTTGRHMGTQVDWFDRHFESCNMKFKDHLDEK